TRHLEQDALDQARAAFAITEYHRGLTEPADRAVAVHDPILDRRRFVRPFGPRRPIENACLVRRVDPVQPETRIRGPIVGGDPEDLLDLRTHVACAAVVADGGEV